MDRIERIASLCKGSVCVCDVGCDHAYVLTKAIKQYGVKRGIASDIALGPLENARKNIKESGIIDNVEIVLSNGFQNINSSFDTAIIAGMGGALVVDILTKGINKIKDKKLIIEANCEVYRVRQFVLNNNFRIIYEDAFYDQGKYYEIIVCIPGYNKMDEMDILYGPLLRKNPTESYITYYNKKIDLLNNVIPQIQNKSKKDEKINELNELLSIFRYKNMNKYNILNTKNYYRTYFIDDNMRTTIFVAAGGGYEYTSPRESEPVVEAFNKRGYHVIVVNYRENNEEAYPMPGTYLSTALNEIKKDKRVGKVIGLGFSAGGHCILEMCLHHDYYNVDNLEFLMLAYPVITADENYAHLGSFKWLLKDKVDNQELRKYLSLENEVKKENAPELFLWGTYEDKSVPVMNSLLLLEAYNKVQVSAEYHMFPYGAHGLSVANEKSAQGNIEKINPYVARWVDLACEWIKLKIK